MNFKGKASSPRPRGVVKAPLQMNRSLEVDLCIWHLPSFTTTITTISSSSTTTTASRPLHLIRVLFLRSRILKLMKAG